MTGPLNKRYRGGYQTPQGYQIVYDPDGKRVLEHRLVIEQHFQRKLFPFEVVHHLNHNKSDNRLENLQVMAKGTHAAKHHGARDAMGRLLPRGGRATSS